MRVLITRPRSQALDLARELEGRGHKAVIEPLLTIEPVARAAPSLAGVQAIVLTSANAVPALTGPLKALPMFAVGAATAAQARLAGCAQVTPAAGDGRELARLIARRCRPSDGALLHLSGAEVRAGLAEELAAAGFDLRRQVVYRAVGATGLSPEVSRALRAGALDAILLFSPRSAAVLVDLVVRQGLRDGVRAAAAICLSAAVAAPCGALPWRGIHIAARPERRALVEALEAAGRRC